MKAFKAIFCIFQPGKISEEREGMRVCIREADTHRVQTETRRGEDVHIRETDRHRKGGLDQ